MKILSILSLALFLSSCGSPTVQIAASDKPIEINLNIKIDHNIKVQVDKQVSELVSKNEEGIF